MADNVQWIKMKVGMFDGNSFKKIKRAKIGGVSYRDKLTAVWFELLDLAGKSNCSGFLIDNNEIPYHSFDDIACMLDRDEKEIELCMQFFINEKMVEIINDIYKLSNFEKYQCVEGLDKIREQRRIAQAKWRQRSNAGLIGTNNNVDSTVDSTDHLHSNSISNSISNSNINNNKEKERNIDISKEKEYSEKKSVFEKPTIEEIESYCRENNIDIDVYKFFYYYDSIDWCIGKKKMKNWKSAVRTWERNDSRYSATNKVEQEPKMYRTVKFCGE